MRVTPTCMKRLDELDGDSAVRNDCPLNGADSIVRMCERCRMCFNAEATRRAMECQRSKSA